MAEDAVVSTAWKYQNRPGVAETEDDRVALFDNRDDHVLEGYDLSIYRRNCTLQGREHTTLFLRRPEGYRKKRHHQDGDQRRRLESFFVFTLFLSGSFVMRSKDEVIVKYCSTDGLRGTVADDWFKRSILPGVPPD